MSAVNPKAPIAGPSSASNPSQPLLPKGPESQSHGHIYSIVSDLFVKDKTRAPTDVELKGSEQVEPQYIAKSRIVFKETQAEDSFLSRALSVTIKVGDKDGTITAVKVDSAVLSTQLNVYPIQILYHAWKGDLEHYVQTKQAEIALKQMGAANTHKDKESVAQRLVNSPDLLKKFTEMRDKETTFKTKTDAIMDLIAKKSSEQAPKPKSLVLTIPKPLTPPTVSRAEVSALQERRGAMSVKDFNRLQQIAVNNLTQLKLQGGSKKTSAQVTQASRNPLEVSRVRPATQIQQSNELDKQLQAVFNNGKINDATATTQALEIFNENPSIFTDKLKPMA